MKHVFETSLKFPNNFVQTKPVAVPQRATGTFAHMLQIQITSNSDIEIPLIPLKAEQFGEIDLSFYGVPIEVRQKGKVLLYGIFKGDYFKERLTNQKPYELIGIPQREFFRAQFESTTAAFVSPIFLGVFTMLSVSVNNV